MAEVQITAGLSKHLDRYYALSVGVDNEGGIGITEVYDYPARGEVEGREYRYQLHIPAVSAPAFLGRLAWEGRREVLPASTDRQRWLVALFKQLVQQGVLAAVETATARQNLETLIAWLEQAQIPYEQDTWSFSGQLERTSLDWLHTWPERFDSRGWRYITSSASLMGDRIRLMLSSPCASIVIVARILPKTRRYSRRN